MENTVFEAVNTNSATIWTALAVALLCGIGAVWFQYTRFESVNKRLQQIGQMLLFYGVLISLGVAGFSFWQNTKTVDLVFKEDSVETPYGVLKYNNIKNAKIQTETMSSLANPNMVRSRIQLLVITETNGKSHVLSEENYPIRNVLGEIRERIKKE